eukprot:1028532-Amphidinium_carterae.1
MQDSKTFEWIVGFDDLQELGTWNRGTPPIVKASSSGCLLSVGSSANEPEELFDKAMLGNWDCRILNLGCGNSAMTEHMHDHGYTNITNADTSSVVIQQMSQRNEGPREDCKVPSTALGFAVFACACQVCDLECGGWWQIVHSFPLRMS